MELRCGGILSESDHWQEEGEGEDWFKTMRARGGISTWEGIIAVRRMSTFGRMRKVGRMGKLGRMISVGGMGS